jgi:hypothetical protein
LTLTARNTLDLTSPLAGRIAAESAEKRSEQAIQRSALGNFRRTDRSFSQGVGSPSSGIPRRRKFDRAESAVPR